MWLVCGLLSWIFTIGNWVLTARDNRKANWALACALGFGMTTLLMEYHLIFSWVGKEDWAALLSAVPATFSKLVGYTILLIIANGIPLLLRQRKK